MSTPNGYRPRPTRKPAIRTTNSAEPFRVVARDLSHIDAVRRAIEERLRGNRARLRYAGKEPGVPIEERKRRPHWIVAVASGRKYAPSDDMLSLRTQDLRAYTH